MDSSFSPACSSQAATGLSKMRRCLEKVVANLCPIGLDVHTSAEGCILLIVAQARPQCGLTVHATHDRRDNFLNLGGLVGDGGLDVLPRVQASGRVIGDHELGDVTAKFLELLTAALLQPVLQRQQHSVKHAALFEEVHAGKRTRP